MTTPVATPKPKEYDYQTHFQLHLESLRPKHVSHNTGIRAFASEAGECDRRLFYRLQQAQATGIVEEEPPRMTSSVAFHIGNNLHDEFQNMMQILHPDFKREHRWVYPSKSDPIVSGRCDGTYTDLDGKTVALEIKTVSKWMFLRAVKEDTPDPHHRIQAAMSQALLNTDLVHIVYICKEWIPGEDALRRWKYKPNPNITVDEIERMKRILLTVLDNGIVPPRIARGIPIANPETDHECTFCPFQDNCLIEGPPVPPRAKRTKQSTAGFAQRDVTGGLQPNMPLHLR